MRENDSGTDGQEIKRAMDEVHQFIEMQRVQEEIELERELIAILTIGVPQGYSLKVCGPFEQCRIGFEDNRMILRFERLHWGLFNRR